MAEKNLKTKDDVGSAFADQADLCRRFGSPFTGQILRCFAEIIDRETEYGRSILDWSGSPGALGDALPLRVSAAFHALARSNRFPEITALYPPNPMPSDKTLKAALAAAFAAEQDWLKGWLDYAPQTNEVGRSACLFLGLMTVAERFGFPLRLFEIGSGAGLNLNLDRYAYKFAGQPFGATETTLRLTPDWTGGTPAGRTPRVVERRGCDLSPFDLSDIAQRERVLAYVWPDQKARLERACLAVKIAREHPPQVEQCDAVEWVSQNLALPETGGTATVLMHSLTWSYIPQAGRTVINEHMETLGASATDDAPLAWVMFELGDGAQPALRLRQWPGGRDELLAFADPHCWTINWQL